MSYQLILEQFSKNRLKGEAVPEDVKILLQHSEKLTERLAIELNWQEGWEPWLDTSYLSDEALANSDIVANVKALAKVCEYIAFIAKDEENQYYGYWRGTKNRPIAESPLVLFDNEGQFRLCHGTTFSEAIVADTEDYYFQKPGELRSWFQSLGIPIPECIAEPSEVSSPDNLHQELYRRFLT